MHSFALPNRDTTPPPCCMMQRLAPRLALLVGAKTQPRSTEVGTTGATTSDFLQVVLHWLLCQEQWVARSPRIASIVSGFQVPQFILWLWSRTFETWFPGSATRRFLVTSPSMNVSTRETRRCTERIKSPDRLQDNARLLSLPPPPAIDAVCGRTAIRRMQRWPRASSGDLRSGHTPHMQMMPESKPGKAMASSTLVRLGSKRNHGNSARLPQNRPRKQLAGINADTSTGTDHSRQTATAQCVR
jgi:hypothetical protein